MQIASALAGYSLGGADLLRRAMGKKKAEDMAKEKAGFLDGAEEKSVDAEDRRARLRPDGEVRRLRLQQVHSAAYGLLTYQTAYLKRTSRSSSSRRCSPATRTTPTRS